MESMPARMRELFHWVIAGAAFDYGDPRPLADLIAAEPIPPEFTRMVGDIVAGRRKLPRKGKANSKVSAARRLEIAYKAGAVQSISSLILKEGFYDGVPGKGAVAIGEKNGVEPIEVVRRIERGYRRVIDHIAERLGVSRRTVENMLIDLKHRIARWPEV